MQAGGRGQGWEALRVAPALGRGQALLGTASPLVTVAHSATPLPPALCSAQGLDRVLQPAALCRPELPEATCRARAASHRLHDGQRRSGSASLSTLGASVRTEEGPGLGPARSGGRRAPPALSRTPACLVLGPHSFPRASGESSSPQSPDSCPNPGLSPALPFSGPPSPKDGGALEKTLLRSGRP